MFMWTIDFQFCSLVRVSIDFQRSQIFAFFVFKQRNIGLKQGQKDTVVLRCSVFTRFILDPF